MRSLTTLLITSLLAVPAALDRTQDAPPRSVDAESFLFHAVLEGLYTDGVANDVVDAMTEIDEEVGWPKFFIQACPVCHPVFDALRTYRVRKEFYGRKMRADTFGKGLPEPVREQLLSPDLYVRTAGIRDRVADWIGRRIELMRLTEAERDALEQRLAGMREKGTAYLESYRQQGLGVYGHMDFCPSCDGATMGSTK